MSYDLWSRLRYVLSPQFDIYEQVAKYVSGDVADIGCGTGFGTHLLTRGAKYVVGYEVDAAALKFAEKAFSNGNIKFLYGDVTCLPVPNGPFDFVTMIDVIEHIKQDEVALKYCRDILRTNGTFICSTPNRLSRYRKSEYHVREYSPDEFKTLLEKVFDNVGMTDFQLQPMESEYTNPMIAICQ